MKTLIILVIMMFTSTVSMVHGEQQKETFDSLISQGWEHLHQQQYQKACAKFRLGSQSLQRSQNNQALLGLGYCLKALGQQAEATDIFFLLTKRQYKLDETTAALLDLLIKQNRFQEADRASSLLLQKDKSVWLKRIRTKKAQSGWDCYNQADYQCAQTIFTDLHRRAPANTDFLLGYCYSLIKLDRKEEARSAIAAFSGQRSEQINKLHLNLTKEKGLADYKAGKYNLAEETLQYVVQMDPDDHGLKELLEWSRYHQGRPQGLIEHLEQTYRNTGSVKAASDLITVLKSTKNQDSLDAFIQELAQSDDSELNHLVGGYYHQYIGLVTAAGIDDSPDTCYRGCDQPKLSTGFFYNYRSGDEGLSQLSATGVSLTGEITAATGHIWNLQVSTINLDSGSAGIRPYAGSFFRSIAYPQLSIGEMVETATIYDFKLLYEKEGLNTWKMALGSTPMNGVVTPKPTFSIKYSSSARAPSSWKILLEQKSVDESVLSWIGQDDPYSEKQWGRVLKTGFIGQKNFELDGPYWLTVQGKYHYYWGENVEDNHGLGISMSAGRTDDWKSFSRNIGLSSEILSFQDNHGYYTYGHGGYDSPKYKVSLGPFIRVKSRECRNYLLDMEISLRCSVSETEDAPHYRNPDISGLNTGFLNNSDLTGSYQGESKTEGSVSMKLRGMRYLGGNWFALGSAGLTTTTDGFTEVTTGVFLQYRFNTNPGSTLCDAARQIDLLLSPIDL